MSHIKIVYLWISLVAVVSLQVYVSIEKKPKPKLKLC